MKKQIAYDVVYWLIVLAVLGFTAYGDRGELVFWHRVQRSAQWVAYRAGRLGMTAEARYHIELEKTRL